MAIDFPSKYQGDRLNHAGVRRPPSTLAYTLVNHSGTGYLAGSFPNGLTTIEGDPTPATIRVLLRTAKGHPGDGAVVKEVQSNQDGTWIVEGLNPDLKYDVVGRLKGFNDVIMSNVSPVVADEIRWVGNLEWDGEAVVGALRFTGGTEPYRITSHSGLPAGLTPSLLGNVLTLEGTPTEWGEFTGVIGVADGGSLTADVVVRLDLNRVWPVARFWRVSIIRTRDGGNFQAMLSRLKFLDSDGSEISVGGTATASTHYPSNPPETAFDDGTGAWSSASNAVLGQWIAYEFPSQVEVRGVSLTAGDTAARALRAPEDFYLEYSDDGVFWDISSTHLNLPPWIASETRTYVTEARDSAAPQRLGQFVDGGYFAGEVELFDGKYAVIMAPANMESTGVVWGVDGRPIGGNSQIDGQENTSMLQSLGLSDYPAAAHCIAAGEGWYLPALQEMKVVESVMYTNSHLLPPLFTEGIATTPYWTSSYPTGSSLVSSIRPNQTGLNYLSNPGDIQRVRPVRRIKIS